MTEIKETESKQTWRRWQRFGAMIVFVIGLPLIASAIESGIYRILSVSDSIKLILISEPITKEMAAAAPKKATPAAKELPRLPSGEVSGVQDDPGGQVGHACAAEQPPIQLARAQRHSGHPRHREGGRGPKGAERIAQKRLPPQVGRDQRTHLVDQRIHGRGTRSPAALRAPERIERAGDRPPCERHVDQFD